VPSKTSQQEILACRRQVKVKTKNRVGCAKTNRDERHKNRTKRAAVEIIPGTAKNSK